MGTTLSTLSPPPGAKHRKKRLGRGPGSGKGTTAGKGTKGQESRSGPDIRPGFEGGQMPLQRRLPKRGFVSPFRVANEPVNLRDLATAFAAGEQVGPEELIAKGLAPRKAKRIKILANGELPHALNVKAHAFSASAIEKIKAAGGTAEVIPMAKKGRKNDGAQDNDAGEGSKG